MATKNKNTYRDNPLLKRVGVKQNYTQEQLKEIAIRRKVKQNLSTNTRKSFEDIVNEL